MANESIRAAFERFWQHTIAKIGEKADQDHTHTYSEVGADQSGAAATALSDAKDYTDEQIESLLGGDFAISNAEHADEADHAISADSATKATQDGDGKVIASTYETKADATSKLNTAKKYTDDEIKEWVGDETVATQISEAISTKADTGHTHSINGDTITGTLSASKGGTGNDLNKYPDGAVLVKQSTSSGAAFVDYFRHLPVTSGGTGYNLSTYPDGSILTKATNEDGTSYVDYYNSIGLDSNVVSGTLPLSKGGTGATTAADALIKLGLTATAKELNYVDGVTSNVQTQLDGKSSTAHTHSLAGDKITGVLPLIKGGTGNDLSKYPDGVILNKKTTDNGEPFVDYYTSLNLKNDYISGILPLTKGGTGSNVSLANAPTNAIIRKYVSADGSENSLYYTATNNGAAYATSENGYLKFGTLPIAQGGTGATTAEEVVANLGISASIEELNYVDGVTSNIQEQFAATTEYIDDKITDINNLIGDTPIVDQIEEAMATKSDTGHTHSSLSISDESFKVTYENNSSGGKTYYFRPDKAGANDKHQLGTSQRYWDYIAAEKIGAPSGTLTINGELDLSTELAISEGGTGATTAADARQNINYIGTNPISTTADDTPANWIALGTGVAYYNKDGLLNNQPYAYGFLFNQTTGISLVAQTFFSMSGSSVTYTRSGSTDGWYQSGAWHKNFNDTHTIPLENGGTGSAINLANAATNAIVRKTGDGSAGLTVTSTKNGAFYATEENGAPKFGTLPIEQGGTNATTAAGARTKLGFTYGTSTPSDAPSTGAGSVYFKEFNRVSEVDSLLRLSNNSAPSTDTPSAWMDMGNFICYYGSASTVINKPSDYGTMLQIYDKNKITQIWFTYTTGVMYTRAGSSSGWNSDSSVSGADAWVKQFDSNATIPLKNGGTGSSTGLAGAPDNAMIRKSAGNDYLNYTATGNGAFYATSENGAPQFGTLPVKQGGTGSTSATTSVTITRGSDVQSGSDYYGGTCKYVPYLGMCFIRMYVQPSATWSADTAYEAGSVSSTYKPGSMTALTNASSKRVQTYINTEGKIIVKPHESVGTSYAVRISGFWFV